MAPQNPKASKPQDPKDREPDHLTLNDPGNTDAWPRFLVIEATDKDNSLSNINPFIRAKALKSILGVDPKDVIFYRNSGLLCVEIDTQSQCRSLLQAKMFHNTPIKVSPHRTKNYTKGVFSCRDLANMTEEEILHELKDSHQPVVEIHRITSKRNGAVIPTDTFITTFNTTVLPKDIKIGSLNVKVRPYIPNPRRCFNCQGYGHAKTSCKNKTVCAKCGQEGHEYETCANDPHCLHCKGNHSASSKECPKWRYERKLLELVHTEKITFYEAKQRVSALVNTTAPTRLMSEVVRSNFKKVEMKTVGVQTTDTHCTTCTCQVRPSVSVQTTTSNQNDQMDTETPSAQGRKRHFDSVEKDAPQSESEEEASPSHSPNGDEQSALHTRGRDLTDSPASVAGESGEGEHGTQRTRSRSPIRAPDGSSHQARRSPSKNRHKKPANKIK